MPRGRKKKEDMPRHPNGRINHRQAKQRDNMPVEELIAKRVARLAIAGVHDQDKMQYAESWLGVLYAADVITEAMYVAGNKYQQMFKTFYPQGWPQTNYNAGVDETQAFEPIEDDALDDMDLAFLSYGGGPGAGIVTAYSYDWNSEGGFGYKKPVHRAASALDLTSTWQGYYGATILVSTTGAAFAITLPTTTNAATLKALQGWHIRVIVNDETATGTSRDVGVTDEAVTIETASGAGTNDTFISRIVSVADEGAPANIVHTDDQTLTIIAGAVNGDYVDITCIYAQLNDIRYHVTGVCST